MIQTFPQAVLKSFRALLEMKICKKSRFFTSPYPPFRSQIRMVHLEKHFMNCKEVCHYKVLLK